MTVLAKTQYGFQNNIICHSILDVVTNIYDKINNNEYTGANFWIIKKAFDSISHSIPLHKLDHYGICSEANKLLRSFLSNRNQYVATHELCSNTKTVSYGVPQGSNLGPLLFLIYINDISNVLRSTPPMYTDDTCLVIHASESNTLEEKINLELEKVYKWANANKITVNPQKSFYLIIPLKLNSLNKFLRFSSFLITTRLLLMTQ